MKKAKNIFVSLSIITAVTVTLLVPVGYLVRAQEAQPVSEESVIVEPVVSEPVVTDPIIEEPIVTETPVEETVFIEEPVTEPVITEEFTPSVVEEPIIETATVLSEPILIPELSTDKADYYPGETATIFGRFFQSLQNIFLKIFGSGPDGNDYTESINEVTTDDQGSFVFNYILDNIYRPIYNVIASAVGGEKLAETTFTDSPRIGAVTVGVQSPSPLIATNGNNATYIVSITRTGNGTVNGTMSVAGALPTGVTAAFVPLTWNSTGGNAFPVVTLKLTTNGTTPAGSYAFTVRAADGTDISTGGGGTLVVVAASKTDQTITFGALADKTYGDADFTVSATGGGSGNPVTFTTISTACSVTAGGLVHIISVGSCSIAADQAGNSNYNAATPVTQGFTIKTKDASVTPNANTKIYDATDPTLTGSTSGFLVTDGVTATYNRVVGETVLDSPYTISATLLPVSVLGNYNITYNTANFTITKADSTTVITCPASEVYTGSAITLCSAAVTGAGGLNTTTTVVYANNINFGTATADATYAGDANHNGSTATQKTFNITKASSTTVVTCDAGSFTYTGSAITPCTVSVTGANLSLKPTPVYANNTNVGTANASYTYAGDDNHTVSSDSKNFTINKADRTCTLSTDKTWTRTYDNTPSSTSCSVSAGSDDGSMTFTRSGSPVSTPDSTTNAGTYAYVCQWTEGDNYNDCPQQSNTLTISKADAIVTVNGYTEVYDGNAHGASGTATGVGGVDLSAGLSLGATFTDVPGGTANWAFTNANYADESETVAIVISKAAATIVVTPYNVTYDAAAHTATGTATGVKSESLSGLGLSATTHTNAGDYTGDAWTFTDVTGNYNNASGTVNDKISKADAIVTVNGYTGVYDGNAHGASGTATGVGGVDLSAGLSLGATFTDVPGGTANWAFTNANYADESETVAIVISKAAATIVVTPYNVTYDAAAHTATGTATGVKSESLSGLGLSATTHTNAGDYTGDAWTFTDVTGNYNNASGTVNDKISKADAIVTVNGYTGVYDGNAHGASGTATGVGGVDLSAGLSLGATFTDVPGGTANWAFTNANYADESETVAIVISKAAATIVVTPYNVTYDAAAHTATGTATGVKSESLSGLGLSATTHTNAGDYTGDAWTFTDVTGNYNNASGTVNDKISKADAIVTVNGYTGVYDGNAHGASGTATGVGGVDLSAGLSLGATFTDVPGGTANWAFTNANYADESGTVAIVISKAAASVTPNVKTKTYGDTDPTLTGTLAEFLPADSVTAVYSRTTGEAVAGSPYTISATLSPTGVLGNYNITYNTANFSITNRAVTITADAKSKTYGDADPALTYQITAGTLSFTDAFTGLLTRDAGETVGTYAITQGTVALNANYTLTYVGANLTIGKANLMITADNKTKQYSDPLPTLTVTYAGLVNGDTAPDTLPTINTTALVLSPIGNYPITATGAADSNYTISYTAGTLTVIKEDAAIIYNGDLFVLTAGPTITTAPIRLSAHLDQLDINLGDLTLAKVTFGLFKSTNLTSTPDFTVKDIPVNAAGDALTTYNVPVNVYSIKVVISSGNQYWTQNPSGDGILDVVLGSEDQRVTGGGWIPDALNGNNKNNFGFTVNYNKNGSPKGSLLFMIRGNDGYNYQVKSNSWAKGGLSFTGTNGAYFTSQCTVQKIDRITGTTVESWGSYKFAVNITDGKLSNPKTADTLAITVFNSAGAVWKQIGTATNQIKLGGGSIVVHK